MRSSLSSRPHTSLASAAVVSSCKGSPSCSPTNHGAGIICRPRSPEIRRDDLNHAPSDESSTQFRGRPHHATGSRLADQIVEHGGGSEHGGGQHERLKGGNSWGDKLWDGTCRRSRDRGKWPTIQLMDGVYPAPLTLTGADTGSQKMPVIWEAADGATPIINRPLTPSGVYAHLDIANAIAAGYSPTGTGRGRLDERKRS